MRFKITLDLTVLWFANFLPLATEPWEVNKNISCLQNNWNKREFRDLKSWMVIYGGSYVSLFQVNEVLPRGILSEAAKKTKSLVLIIRVMVFFQTISIIFHYLTPYCFEKPSVLAWHQQWVSRPISWCLRVIFCMTKEPMFETNCRIGEFTWVRARVTLQESWFVVLLNPYVFNLFLESELYLISLDPIPSFPFPLFKKFLFWCVAFASATSGSFLKKLVGTLTACAALLHYLRISSERIHLGLIRTKLNDVAVKLS